MQRLRFVFLGLFFICSPLLRAQQGQDISIGKVYTMDSKIFNEPREYRVLLPRSYDQGAQKYPVLFVLDGDSYYLAAYSAMRALSTNGSMPEAIVVAITTPERAKDMTPPYMDLRALPKGRADKFLAHLTDELIPYLNKTYRTLPLRVLMGHSHGGIFNMYALTENPEAFKWHIAIDAPMHLNEHILEKKVSQLIAKKPDHRARLAVTWARYEWTEERWAKLQSDQNGIKAMSFELQDENHQSMYFLAFYQGLRQLFKDYAYRHEAMKSFDELDSRYKTMTADYGYEVKIPKTALGTGAIEHLAAANLEESRAFVSKLEEVYATRRVMMDDVADWLHSLETNPPTETRKDYLNRPDANAEQLKPFLGKWKSGSKYEFELDIVNGEIKAVLTQYMPDGSAQITPLEKLTIMEEGALEISYANRMTPRSMLIAYRLMPDGAQKLNVKQRLIVYWPKMAGRVPNEEFTLTKVN